MDHDIARDDYAALELREGDPEYLQRQIAGRVGNRFGSNAGHDRHRNGDRAHPYREILTRR
jgi:hypothetical protein